MWFKVNSILKTYGAGRFRLLQEMYSRSCLKLVRKMQAVEDATVFTLGVCVDICVCVCLC